MPLPVSLPFSKSPVNTREKEWDGSLGLCYLAGGPPSFQDQTLPRTLGQEGERWRTKVTEWGRERDKDRKEVKIAGIVET